MATVKPFCGLRPAPQLADKVASLPYDVMNAEEARAMVQNNPVSFLHVTRSEVDLPVHTDIHGPEVYAKARENLERFVADGVLIQDEHPCFYIYRQKMGSHMQIGLVAAASVEEYNGSIIKKHEYTRPDKEQDRVNHITATGAQTGAVFLTYKAKESINYLIAQCMQKDPVYDFIAEDGISHTLYIIDDKAKITAIEDAFRSVPFLYIADGHHRSAAAARVCAMCRQDNPNHTGDEAYNRFLSVIFPHNMMRIMDYNRVVKDLNGLATEQFMAAVSQRFEIAVNENGPYKPFKAHRFGMYLAGTWYELIAKAGTYHEQNPVDSLDVSILQNNLLGPVLGIQDPRTDKRIHFVGGIRGMKELENLVDSGTYAVAFSMFPTSITELMAIADNGQIMPPKSTWFEPKLRDAMVIHLTPCVKE